MISYLAILEAKQKIDFNSLKFPIYRKSEQNREWYRLDSVTTLVSIRKNNVIGIGIAPDIPDNAFTKVYAFEEECSKDEFDKVLNSVYEIISNNPI